MRKVEFLPTRDGKAGYGPGSCSMFRVTVVEIKSAFLEHVGHVWKDKGEILWSRHLESRFRLLFKISRLLYGILCSLSYFPPSNLQWLHNKHLFRNFVKEHGWLGVLFPLYLVVDLLEYACSTYCRCCGGTIKCVTWTDRVWKTKYLTRIFNC